MNIKSDIETVLKNYVINISEIYGANLKQVILYGSYARGDFNDDSDIDIMILLDLPDDEINQKQEALSYMTYDFNMDNDTDIKPIAKNEAHFLRWVKNYPFYTNVSKEGVTLYGAA